jgi:phosphoribosylformylglycinamidine synthase
VYLVGLTKDELGGSHWYALEKAVGHHVPRVDLKLAPRIFAAVHAAIAAGCVRACHDLSEGGLAVAAAEMAFAADLGLDLNLQDAPHADDVLDDGRILFSESTTRFLVEVDRRKAIAFEKHVTGVPWGRIGQVTNTGRLVVRGVSGKTVVEAACDCLRSAWKKPLAW